MEYRKEIVLRKPNFNDIEEIESFKQEFIDNNSGMDGTGKLSDLSAKEWLRLNQKMEHESTPELVKYLQYGLFRGKRLLGLIDIRLELRGYLVEFGGHIGYCVRPQERRKGYGKLMLQKALEVCKEINLNKVLITCLEDNIASSKIIEACGGVYEKTVFDDKNYQESLKRYWIDLDKKI